MFDCFLSSFGRLQKATGSGYLSERHHRALWVSGYLDEDFDPQPDPEITPFRCSHRTTLAKFGPALYNNLLEKPNGISIVAVGPGPVYKALDILSIVGKNSLVNEQKRVRFTINLQKIEDDLPPDGEGDEDEDSAKSANDGSSSTKMNEAIPRNAQFCYRFDVKLVPEHHPSMPERVAGDTTVRDNFQERKPDRQSWAPPEQTKTEDRLDEDDGF